MDYRIPIALFILFTGCTPHETSLDDLAEEVESKGKGVTIDIEPGQKK